MISKSDYINWKSDPVTRAFFEATRERVEEAKEMLAVSAGIDPTLDNFYRGFIKAYREIEEFTVEGTE